MTNRQPQTTPGYALGTLAAFVAGLVALGGLVWYLATLDSPWTASLAVVWAYVAKKLMDLGVGRVLALGRAQQARDAEWVANTGVWKVHEGGSFTVRWAPEERTHYVQGWTGPFTQLTHEARWEDQDALRRMIEEAEADGMVPEDDPGTRSIRARLMVKGWDS